MKRGVEFNLEVQTDHRGMTLPEYNRLRDRLEQQTWTAKDVERLQERVRRLAKRKVLRG